MQDKAQHWIECTSSRVSFSAFSSYALCRTEIYMYQKSKLIHCILSWQLASHRSVLFTLENWNMHLDLHTGAYFAPNGWKLYTNKLEVIRTQKQRKEQLFSDSAYLVTPLARPTLQARTPLRLLIMLLFPTLGKPEENHINPCKLNKKT